MQDLVWLHVWVRAIRFGAVRFGTSYSNLRWPYIFKHKIWGKYLVLHSIKYGNHLEFSVKYDFIVFCYKIKTYTTFATFEINITSIWNLLSFRLDNWHLWNWYLNIICNLMLIQNDFLGKRSLMGWMQTESKLLSINLY